MAKVTGMEALHQVPPKVLMIYEAVEKLIAGGEDIGSVCVSNITEMAGIGKGTAYDYFESKDDLIACSLLYQIRKLADEIKVIFSGEKSFAEEIKLCMDEIERKKENQQCLLRYVHVMTGNAEYCQIVREKMQQQEYEEQLPLHVLYEMAERGKARGEIKKDIPSEYVVYEVFSKLLGYMVVSSAKECVPRQLETMRTYAYQALLDELCEKNV